MNARDFEEPVMRPLATVLGTGELAEKTVGHWLGNGAVESVRHQQGTAVTWSHRLLAPRLTREQAAVEAVRTAMTETMVPHAYTQTVPHPRHVQAVAMRDHCLDLTREEIYAATVEVMAP